MELERDRCVTGKTSATSAMDHLSILLNSVEKKIDFCMCVFKKEVKLWPSQGRFSLSPQMKVVPRKGWFLPANLQ
jgi:hypothetical protein